MVSGQVILGSTVVRHKMVRMHCNQDFVPLEGWVEQRCMKSPPAAQISQEVVRRVFSFPATSRLS